MREQALAQAGAFRRALLGWYGKRHRELPWRQTKDFYRVWISETMLQQTRVEAVIPYFGRFLTRFPTVEAVAEAEESAVLAEWSGLGYYSRARNLHRAAKKLAGEGLPASYSQLRELPGVGPYTAAAVASIALGLPHAAVDGNVMRVISRLLADAGEIASLATRRRFGEIADELLDKRRPGDFNQAMMELGATVCVPRNPACAECPVEKFCAGRAAGVERELPVKKRAGETRGVALELVAMLRAGSVLLLQRAGSERRMAGFWELPEKRMVGGVRGPEKASFTHQIVNDRFRIAVWSSKTGRAPEGRWVPVSELSGLPVTTVTRKALQVLGVLPGKRTGIPSPRKGI